MQFFEYIRQNFLNILDIWIYLINIVAFVAMGIDKHRAQNQTWRIPEKTLFLFALLGGSLGGIIGMYVYRHKTRHRKFSVGFPAIFLIQSITGIFIYMSI